MTSARFYASPITVEFDVAPFLEKKPSCPDRFHWEGRTFEITTTLAAWNDYRRRGRMAENMRPEHLSRASQKGSWGVGRFYFRVCTAEGRVFEIYYDRAPKGQKQRKGSWTLSRELFD